jgi:flagellar basal-body rod modification protein FlgD
MALGSTPAVSQASNLTGSSLEDFLSIMVMQLRYQDPMQPLTNQEFVAQMAQFAALEQTRTMSSNMESLLSVQASTQSIGLLGRSVDVTTVEGALLTGKVTALDFKGSEPKLTVSYAVGGGAQSGTFLLSQVTAVR